MVRVVIIHCCGVRCRSRGGTGVKGRGGCRKGWLVGWLVGDKPGPTARLPFNCDGLGERESLVILN